MIAGRPAKIRYSPPGARHDRAAPVWIWIYDPATQREYEIFPGDATLRGDSADTAIAIARSLFEPPNAP